MMDDDDKIVVVSSYSINKNGVLLSFAVPIYFCEVNEVVELSEAFTEYVLDKYGKLIKDGFSVKSETPYIYTDGGGALYMVWTFVTHEEGDAIKLLKKLNIPEVCYDN